MDDKRTTCVACNKAIFGQSDCPFCKTKQPNKMRRGSTKNARWGGDRGERRTRGRRGREEKEKKEKKKKKKSISRGLTRWPEAHSWQERKERKRKKRKEKKEERLSWSDPGGRALGKGEQLGLAAFIGTEMGAKPAKPGSQPGSRRESGVREGDVEEAEATPGEEGAEAAPPKKPEPNPAAMQMAALMKGAVPKKTVAAED